MRFYARFNIETFYIKQEKGHKDGVITLHANKFLRIQNFNLTSRSHSNLCIFSFKISRLHCPPPVKSIISDESSEPGSIIIFLANIGEK